MESVIAKTRKWRSESSLRSVKILNHYWSEHDHCVCSCLRCKSVKLHGSVEILLG